MREVIQKLKELTDVERDGQEKSSDSFSHMTSTLTNLYGVLHQDFEALVDSEKTSFLSLVNTFQSGFEALRMTIISTSAEETAQRMSLALRAEKIAEEEAAARRLDEREARQEQADNEKKLSLLTDDGEIDFGSILGRFGEMLGGGDEGFFSTVFGAIGEFVGNFFADFIASVTVLYHTNKKGFNKLIKNIGGSLGKRIKAIGSLFGRFGAILGRIGGLISKAFLPLTIILSAFAGIFKAVERFKNEEGTLLDKMIAGLEGFFQGFLGFIVGGILDLGKDILAWLLGALGFDGAKEALNSFSFTEIIDNLVSNVFDTVTLFFKSIFDGMFDGFLDTEGNIIDKIFGAIAGYFSGLLDFFTFGLADTSFIKDFFSNIAGFFNDLFGGIIDGFMSTEGNLLQKILGAFIGYYTGLIDGIAGFFGFDDFSIKEWFSSFLEKLWNDIKGVFTKIFEKSKEIVMRIAKAHVKIAKWTSGFIGNIWDSVKGFFKNIFDKGKKAAMRVAMKYVNVGKWVLGFVRDLWDTITEFFKSVIDKGKKSIVDIGEKMINIVDAIKGFIANILPDPDSFSGKLLRGTGIYDFVGVDTPADTKPSIDKSVIIPPTAPIGEALTQAGNMTNATSVTVVNNNTGGNVTNNSTSSQVNNSRVSSPPIVSGSALAM